jgi:capsular exopolysaccharide synthesis family protein
MRPQDGAPTPRSTPPVANPPETSSADWLEPPEEQEGLRRYVETIRERIWLIVATTAITTLVAIAYVLTATKTYDAEAELLVTPVSGDNPVLSTLGLIRESADPTRDVETAAQLVTNIDVAEAVDAELESSLSARELLDKVSAEPVAQSNIVAVTASETSPEKAQELADSFAEQAVALHTERIREQIDQQIPLLERSIGVGADPARGDVSTGDLIAQLRYVRSGPAPDMRVQTLAPLPSGQASPRPVLSVAAGVLAGVILGIAAAFAAQILDPRLRREAQLRRLYRLPILGRVPKESRTQEKPIAPDRVSPVTGEAYRTLRATLAARTGEGRGRVILITGASPAEGKTTTALNLAASLALAGKRVIMIESDLRRPVLGETLGVSPEHGGVVSVLIENTTLPESLTQISTYGPNLQLLLADYEGGWIAELFSIPTAERMIEEARVLADYVIVDSPPLNEVVDALPLARQADDVLIVVRLGATRLDKLAQLAELLAENGIRPVGFAVVGTPRPSRGEYHYYAGVSSGSGNGRAGRSRLRLRAPS